MGIASKLKSTSELLNRTKSAGRRVLELELDKVVIDEEQVRSHFDETALAGLAVSLKNQGQIEPIVVSPIKDGVYKIQKGERRYRAAKIAGLAIIEAIINEDTGLSETNLAMQQLAENIQREDLLPLEIAIALGKLKDAGMSGKAMSEELGKSAPWISQHLSILDSSEMIKKLIEAGKAQDATTIYELNLLYSDNPSVCDAYCLKVLETDGAIASRAEVKKLREEVLSASKQEASKKPKDYSSYRVNVDSSSVSSLERLVSKLNENPNSPYGEIDVNGLIKILVDSLSSLDVEKGELTGISLQLV